MLNTLLKLDQQLTNRLKLPQIGCVWWRPAALLAHSGDSWFWAIAVGLVWLFGDPFWHSYAVILEFGICTQALLVFALKGRIKRQRPDGEWGQIYRQIDPHSFPSGHAARAALLVTLAIGLGPAWFGWAVAVWAPLMSLSRVMTGVHYLSDILGGIVVGVLYGLLVIAISPLLTQLFPFLF